MSVSAACLLTASDASGVISEVVRSTNEGPSRSMRERSDAASAEVTTLSTAEAEAEAGAETGAEVAATATATPGAAAEGGAERTAGAAAEETVAAVTAAECDC